MSNSLFIGSLSWNTTEQSLHQHLASVASPISVSIPTDKATGKSRGFAFVDMASADDAHNVINALNEQELDGRRLFISIAREEVTEACKLYVAGLTENVTEEELNNILSAHGSVVKVSINRDRDTRRSRGFAFIDTASEKDSELMITACNGMMLHGKSILVRKSRPKPEKQRRAFRRHV